MAIDEKLAALARSVLEEQASATIQPNPFARWRRWTRVDPSYQLAKSIQVEHGGALDPNEMDRAMAILTVAEDAFERYGRTEDRGIIASINDLLRTTIGTLRTQLPGAVSEFCLAHLVIIAVASEMALRHNDDRFRLSWREGLIAYAVEYLDLIKALPELGTAWEAVDLALCYANSVVGINRRIQNSWTWGSLSWQAGQFSMEANNGFERSWWRVQALEYLPDPARVSFGIESIRAGNSPTRFLAVSSANELTLATADQSAAKWTISFPSPPTRAFGHVTIRNSSTGLFLVTRPESGSPAILRAVEQSELDAVQSDGAEITWRLG